MFHRYSFAINIFVTKQIFVYVQKSGKYNTQKPSKGYNSSAQAQYVTDNAHLVGI